MDGSLRVPPGRAGRLWLHRRLVMAERGLSLLERKLRVLVTEHRRLAAEAERTAGIWTTACVEADTWILRAAVADGRNALRTRTSPAQVALRWTDIMGVRYPAEATCAVPDTTTTLPSSATAVRARAAAGAAIEAATHHAAAREAERLMGEQVIGTRQRIRALSGRLIPRLTAAINAIDLAVDEMERSDTARLLRARDRPRTKP